ncbi:MAG TPA: hypothetical protein VG318_11620 [Actinomycetota bacterium]|nr:hypothetical protein [Actinomycetota bacterium]
MKKIVLLVGVLVGALLPAAPAVAAPSIAFLNPSAYTTQMRLSDAEDRDGFVHLVAWAKEIPANALVEFELKPPGQNAATFVADRVGNDTWEKLIPIPDTYPDVAGYALTARLYSGVAGNADEVANDEVLVEVDQSEVPPPQGQTVELSYPENGGRAGFFTPKGKRPNIVLDYQASTGTNQVRAFYTLSDPGADPVWGEACGTGTPDEQGFGKVRCTLREGHNPLDVNAVAIVSNKTAPPAPPSAQLDDTGDAHRVLPYAQVPGTVEVSPGAQTVPLAQCFLMAALVEDQFGRAIAAANVDLHAEGPEDELYFESSTNQTDTFQAPDNGHVSRENAKRCSDNANSGQQGDHNSPGRDDQKHIESVDGTSDGGRFRFALRSDFAGGTFVTAWADVNDDDALGLTEASGGTQLGWGSPPPPPSLDVFLTPASATASTGSCAAFEILARRGGSPFSSANVDIHASGPEGVEFCDPEGFSARRAPESGGHLADAHEDGTRHAEGEADSNGKFVFGVKSEVPGETQLQVWIDSNDDDLLSGEPSKSATVTWQPPGERSITIQSNKSRVAKGRRVRLSGAIQGDPACSGGQPVSIQAKPVSGGRFGTVKTATTDEDGDYAVSIKMRKSRKFRATVSAAGSCSAAQSRTITVRVRR